MQTKAAWSFWVSFVKVAHEHTTKTTRGQLTPQWTLRLLNQSHTVDNGKWYHIWRWQIIILHTPLDVIIILKALSCTLHDKSATGGHILQDLSSGGRVCLLSQLCFVMTTDVRSDTGNHAIPCTGQDFFPSKIHVRKKRAVQVVCALTFISPLLFYMWLFQDACLKRSV